MELTSLFQKYQKIVIMRHKNPDLDAYGAQFGLFYALKEFLPHHEILAVGDSNSQNHVGVLIEMKQEHFEGSLCFVLDTVAKQMIESLDFERADHIVLIDHHQNKPDIKYHDYLHNPQASSTAEMIVDLLEESHIPIPYEASRALYLGIVGDTGRFQYSNTTSHTFEVVSKLLKTGIDIQSLYQLIYSESLKMKLMKSEFFASISLTKHFVAYRKNDIDFLEKHQIDTFTASRGLVNQMAGITEIPIWANFTFDRQTGTIVCELRSRSIPIVDIAKKYGGGGHSLACGCSLKTWEETDLLLADIDQLLEETHG